MSIDEKATYYDAGGIEVIDVIKTKLTEEQYVGFLLGNVIKYTLRSNSKGMFTRDIEKLGYYHKLLEALL